MLLSQKPYYKHRDLALASIANNYPWNLEKTYLFLKLHTETAW